MAIGTQEIDSSTFTGNSAENGGAIYSIGIREINNSTFTGNSAVNGGGAVFSEGGTQAVSNSTFWNNPAANASGASVQFVAGAIVTLFGNILANDDSSRVFQSDSYEGFIDAGANLFTGDPADFDVQTIGTGASKNVTAAELKLQTLALNTVGPINTGTTKTVALGDGSIAENYYTPTSLGAQEGVMRNNLATTDQRGVARPFGSGYDVGAFEFGADPVVAAFAALPAPVIKATIKFLPGSSKLTKASKNSLKKLAASAVSQNLRTIELKGFTATFTKADPAGQGYRVLLSRARTKSVEKYLNSYFAKAKHPVKIVRSARGAADPVKSNKTSKGKKENRRVEITIVN